MTQVKNFEKEVQDYWEQPDTISIIDKNLHKIEIGTVCKHLLPSDYLIDIGCGDGEATIQYARKVSECVGIERSSYLRKKAIENVSRSGLSNITIKDGDILHMKNVKPEVDVIITQRLLINLASWKEQQEAIINIHNALKVGGRFIMIENTTDSFLALNEMRLSVGLDPIPQHWHNRFFDYDKLMEFMEGKFQLMRVYDFGLYYFLTRVFTPAFLSFTGFGANAVKDPIFEKSDAAARLMFEKFNDRIHIDGCRVLGPIQTFAFRKEADVFH